MESHFFYVKTAISLRKTEAEVKAFDDKKQAIKEASAVFVFTI
jgi:hypothetical protein